MTAASGPCPVQNKVAWVTRMLSLRMAGGQVFLWVDMRCYNYNADDNKLYELEPQLPPLHFS